MVPPHKVVIRLTSEQRQSLEKLVHSGKHSAHTTRRARILLKADADGPDAWPDGERAAEALRGAQLVIRATHPNPYYWGAFIIQGDPGSLPSLGLTRTPLGSFDGHYGPS